MFFFFFSLFFSFYKTVEKHGIVATRYDIFLIPFFSKEFFTFFFAISFFPGPLSFLVWLFFLPILVFLMTLRRP
jgi:hypothetical protein